MDFWTNFIQQARSLWDRSSATYRVALVASIVMVVLTVAGVGWWASRPQYIPLVEQLSPTEAAEIRDRLDAAQIPARMSFSGATVLVPEHRWNDATLAVNDVLGELPASDDASGSSIWDAPEVMQARLLKEKQRMLAHSIMRMKHIDSATVNLAIPEAKAFIRDKNDPTASVVIGTKRDVAVTPEQAASIAALVAASVDGLNIENVTVVDDARGLTVYPNAQANDGGWHRHYEFRKQLEADLSRKAESMLARTLGEGRAVVRVSAEVDFTETEREQTLYEPDGGVKVSEKIVSTENTGSSAQPIGPAGTSSNLNAVGNGRATSGGSAGKSETVDTTWQNSITTDRVRQFGGSTQRLTISALVDLPTPDSDSQESLDLVAVEELIKKAVGYSEERGDEIAVQQSALPGADTQAETLVDTLNRWEFYNHLVRNASLGLAAVVALVIGLLLIRRLQPLPATPVSEASSNARSALLSELSEQARENPEIVSQIIHAWLNTPATIPIRPETEEEIAPTPHRAAA